MMNNKEKEKYKKLQQEAVDSWVAAVERDQTLSEETRRKMIKDFKNIFVWIELIDDIFMERVGIIAEIIRKNIEQDEKILTESTTSDLINNVHTLMALAQWYQKRKVEMVMVDQLLKSLQGASKEIKQERSEKVADA